MDMSNPHSPLSSEMSDITKEPSTDPMDTADHPSDVDKESRPTPGTVPTRDGNAECPPAEPDSPSLWPGTPGSRIPQLQATHMTCSPPGACSADCRSSGSSSTSLDRQSSFWSPQLQAQHRASSPEQTTTALLRSSSSASQGSSSGSLETLPSPAPVGVMSGCGLPANNPTQLNESKSAEDLLSASPLEAESMFQRRYSNTAEYRSTPPTAAQHSGPPPPRRSDFLSEKSKSISGRKLIKRAESQSSGDSVIHGKGRTSTTSPGSGHKKKLEPKKSNDSLQDVPLKLPVDCKKAGLRKFFKRPLSKFSRTSSMAESAGASRYLLSEANASGSELDSGEEVMSSQRGRKSAALRRSVTDVSMRLRRSQVADFEQAAEPLAAAAAAATAKAEPLGLGQHTARCLSFSDLHSRATMDDDAAWLEGIWEDDGVEWTTYGNSAISAAPNSETIAPAPNSNTVTSSPDSGRTPSSPNRDTITSAPSSLQPATGRDTSNIQPAMKVQQQQRKRSSSSGGNNEELAVRRPGQPLQVKLPLVDAAAILAQDADRPCNSLGSLDLKAAALSRRPKTGTAAVVASSTSASDKHSPTSSSSPPVSPPELRHRSQSLELCDDPLVSEPGNAADRCAGLGLCGAQRSGGVKGDAGPGTKLSLLGSYRRIGHLSFDKILSYRMLDPHDAVEEEDNGCPTPLGDASADSEQRPHNVLTDQEALSTGSGTPITVPGSNVETPMADEEKTASHQRRTFPAHSEFSSSPAGGWSACSIVDRLSLAGQSWVPTLCFLALSTLILLLSCCTHGQSPGAAPTNATVSYTVPSSQKMNSSPDRTLPSDQVSDLRDALVRWEMQHMKQRAIYFKGIKTVVQNIRQLQESIHALDLLLASLATATATITTPATATTASRGGTVVDSTHNE